MAKLNLETFKQNASNTITERESQGIFSDLNHRTSSIEVSKIFPNPFQIRLNKKYLEELKDSIEQFGQLEPIVVAQYTSGYEILDGHQRYFALKDLGYEAAICSVMNVVEDEAKFFPYILNSKHSLDDFEVNYYLERLQYSKVSIKDIHKKLGLDAEEHTQYGFEYDLIEVLASDGIINYNDIKTISQIQNITLRDETLDNIIQKLISRQEINNYLDSVRDEILGKKFSYKTDGYKIKKSSNKFSIDIDNKYLDYNDKADLFNFIQRIIK